MSEGRNPLAALGALRDFWEHWGFQPWSEESFAGVTRRQHFVKSGLLGTVAEFNAQDYIVWDAGASEERAWLWNSRQPIPGFMTQRFLFLLERPWPDRRIRSFTLGFRGYLEFFAYYPGAKVHAKAKDLSGLVDLGLNLLHGGGESEPVRERDARPQGAGEKIVHGVTGRPVADAARSPGPRV
jgi:hypothetical protein